MFQLFKKNLDFLKLKKKNFIFLFLFALMTESQNNCYEITFSIAPITVTVLH